MKQPELRKLIRETIKKELIKETDTSSIRLYKPFDKMSAELEKQLPDTEITETNWPVVAKFIKYLFDNGRGYNVKPKDTFEEYVDDHENFPTKGIKFNSKNDLVDHLYAQYYYGGL